MKRLKWLCCGVLLCLAGLPPFVEANNNEAMIDCDCGTSSLSIQVLTNAPSSRVCTVTKVSIDNLFAAPNITIRGLEGDNIVYTKSNSKLWQISQQASWFGVLISTNNDSFEGSATFFEHQGDVIGTFITSSTSYILKKTASGTFQIEAASLSDLASFDAAPSVVKRDSAFDTINTSSAADSPWTLVEPIATIGQPLVSTANGTLIATKPNERRGLQGKTIIDVLFVVTNRAYCQQASQPFGCAASQANIEPMNLQISLELIKMNDALNAANVNATLKTVGVLFLSNQQLDFDTSPNAGGSNDGLEYLLTNSAIRDLRDQVLADLVTMITGGSGPKGIGALNGYASVANRAFFSLYAVQHVLGNFGCGFDRRTSVEQSGSAYAYTVDGKFYTIMGFANTCTGSCVLVPFFSENGASVTLPNGGGTFPLGTPTEDNARQLRSSAPSVAAFKTTSSGPNPTPPPTPPPVPKAPLPQPTPSPPVSAPSPTRRPNPNPTTPPFGFGNDGTITICFSSNNTVVVRGKGMISIEDLQIGDYVMATASGQFSRVYSFAHKDHFSIGDYLQIHVGGRVIEVSGAHMLFVHDNHVVLAKDVVVGDRLGVDFVVKIETVQRRGLFAPLTESSEIFVSGVKASSYVDLLDIHPSLQIHVYHSVLFPLRLMCQFGKFCRQEKYANGISNRVAWQVWFAHFLRKHASPTVQLTGVVAISPLLLGIVVLEYMILNPVFAAALLVAWIVLRAPKKNRHSTCSKQERTAVDCKGPVILG